MTTLHFRTRLSLALAGPFALVASAHAGHQIDPPANPPDAPWMEPLIGTGLKTSDQYTDGHIFLTLPLWTTIGREGTLGGNYLFLEPYTSVGRGGEVATSLGLSWRHLFSDQPVRALQEKKGMAKFMEEGWFVGGSVFGDMLNTEHHNQFWQMGVGAEVGTRYLEFHGNYYIPFTDEKQFASNTSRQTFSSSSTTTSRQTSNGGSGLFAEGNGIVDRDFQKTTETTSVTTTTTTVTSTTRLFEKGMEGWDAEAVLLVPWLDQWMDCRVNGGYFHFNNQPFGPQNGPTGPVRGWKAGAEVRPVPAIVLGSEWYQDERFAGSNWIVSVEFQIPLERHWTDAFRMRPRHLVEHLAEPVHRQNDAVKVGNRSEQENKVASKTTTQQSTKVLQTIAGETVVASDLIFVNNGAATSNGIQAGSAGGNGTAENPVNTVNAGAGLAGTQSNNSGNVWTVYVQGGAANYTGTTTITGSVHLLGSSQSLTVSNGKIFGGTGPNPVLDGAIVADGVANPTIQSLSVQGFTILHGSGGNGIDLSNIPTITIQNNFIQQAASHGIQVATSGGNSSSATIEGNVIQSSGSDGIALSTSISSTLTATVQNNSIQQSSASGIALSSADSSTLTATLQNNDIQQSSTRGIALSATNTSTLTATLTGNTITNAGQEGVYASASGDFSLLTLTASNNTITAPGTAGFSLITNTSSSSSGIIADLENNTINQAGGAGVYALTQNGYSSLTANGNTITSSTGDGMNISTNTNLAVVYVVLTSNTITNAGGNGIVLSDSTSVFSEISATVNGNTITGSTLNGIDLQFHDLGIGVLSEVSGSVSNIVTGSGGFSLEVLTTTHIPSNIILNGTNILPPVTTP